MVDKARFELATSALRRQRSTGLIYLPIENSGIWMMVNCHINLFSWVSTGAVSVETPIHQQTQ